MATKPGARDLIIKEQIIEDLASGLTIQFERNDERADCPFMMIICGDSLPFGNREILFTPEGEEGAAGTFVGGRPKPSWITEIPITNLNT